MLSTPTPGRNNNNQSSQNSEPSTQFWTGTIRITALTEPPPGFILVLSVPGGPRFLCSTHLCAMWFSDLGAALGLLTHLGSVL